MNEDDTGLLVSRSMFLAIVNEYVSGVHVHVLVAGKAGDDRYARKMLGCPFDFLRRGPIAQRKSGQDPGFEVLHSVKKNSRVGHFAKGAVEIGSSFKSAPEGRPAVHFDIVFGAHAENLPGTKVEVGKDPIRVQEELGQRFQSHAGITSTKLVGRSR